MRHGIAAPGGAHETPKPAKRAPPIAPPRIVSSAHLAVGRGAEVSEFEYGMIICGHGRSSAGSCAARRRPA